MAGDIHPNPGPIGGHPLGICHSNVCSFQAQSKLDELKVLADGSYIDILTLSETWLNPDDTDISISIPGFQNAVRHDRTDMQGGGVAILSRQYKLHRMSCLVFTCLATRLFLHLD